MTPDEHAAKAEELAERAGKTYAILTQASEERGGVIQTHIHAALFTEISALSALAQVHATLAARRP